VPAHPQGYLEAKTRRMDHMIENSYFSDDEAAKNNGAGA
jgi:hypothetical protein